MKHSRRLTSFLLGAMLSAAAAAADKPDAPPMMQVHDLASPFVDVWDRNVGKTDEDQMLMNLPANMAQETRRQLARALDDLHAKLDSTDQEAYNGLFLRKGDSTGLPARRGYYLGMLVAEEAAKTMSLQQLAKLDCEAVRPVVVAAVERLRGKQAH